MSKKSSYEKILNETFFLNGPLSIFLNRSFFIRRGIFRGIIGNKAYISGDVLDFGCGAKPYQNLFQYKSYTGLDADVSGHPHEGESVDVFYDGTQIPFTDGKFDSIFSSEVFEHIEDLDFSVGELWRVLRPGGYLLFTMPFAMEEHETPYDFRRLTPFGIESMLKKHNFSIIKMEKINTYLETIFQLFIFYVTDSFPKNRILRFALSLLIIAPLNIFSFVIANIFPKKKTFFTNILCVAQKPR